MNHITVDYVGMLLNSREMKPGDSLIKRVRKGINVRTLAPGSIPLASQVTASERLSYALDHIVSRVSYSEWDLMNGTIGTAEEIRAEMLAKLRDEFQGRIFNALSTIWSSVNTPDNYTSVGGAVTATVLEDAINRVIDVTGGVRAVVGVRNLMNPITKFGSFVNDGAVSATVEGVDSQKQMVVDRGMLGKFYGAPLNFCAN